MGIGSFFKGAAPFLSAALPLIGGPAGTLAANILTKAVGSTVDPSKIADTMAELVKTQDGILKLKQAEMDFQKAMAALGYDNEEKVLELAAGDRDSARKREMSVRDRMPMVLGLAITVGFFGMLYLAATHGVRQDSKDLVNIMLGSLGTAWISVTTYYFGSSAGSVRKTELLASAEPVKS